MQTKHFLFLILFVFVGTPATFAKSKKKQAAFKLIEAYTQRSLPGIPGAPVQTDTKFIILWQGASYPETFFWRGESGWLSCRIDKAHKVKPGTKNIPRGMEYTTEFVTGEQMHKGDTLQLTPVTGGRFPIPKEIPASAKNTLFYKTAGSGWLAFQVKTITQKPDIARP